MTVYDLYDLVEKYYDYKIHMKSINSQTNEVEGLLYDSFLLKCDINDRYERFGAGIDIGSEGIISVFFG